MIEELEKILKEKVYEYDAQMLTLITKYNENANKVRKFCNNNIFDILRK